MNKCKLGDLLTIKHGFPFKGELFSDEGEYIVLTPGNFYETGGFKRIIGKEKYYLGTFPREYMQERRFHCRYDAAGRRFIGEYSICSRR